MAERVLSEGGKLCVLGKKLGQGGFGSVHQMSVLGLDDSLAIKNVTVGGVFSFALFIVVMETGATMVEVYACIIPGSNFLLNFFGVLLTDGALPCQQPVTENLPRHFFLFLLILPRLGGEKA